MPVLSALIAFLIHVALVLLALQFIETQWPTLARWVKAVIVTTLISVALALFRGWVCSWLC